MTLYLWVGEPIRFTTGSTRVNRVVDEPNQKSTRIKICNLTWPIFMMSQVSSWVSTYFDNSR